MGDLTPTVVQGSLTEKKSPLLCLRFPSYLCPQLISAWDIDMPGITALLCFISGAWLVLKTPNLTGLSKPWTQSPPLEESLSPLHLVPFCAGKTIACPSKGLEFMVKHREICDQVMYPLCGTLSLLLNSCSKVPGGLLFLRDYKPSSKCTPGGGTFSASANQDFPTACFLLCASAPTPGASHPTRFDSGK